MQQFDDPNLPQIFAGLEPPVRAWAMVGYYLTCFARLEDAMVEVLRKALKARTTEIQFVARWMDASSKINALRALLEHCMFDELLVAKHKVTLKRIEGVLKDRNLVAHSFFGPHPNTDGIFVREVRSTNGAKISVVAWSAAQLIEKTRELLALKAAVEEITGFQSADKIFLRRLDIQVDL